jgi:endonuclease III
MKNRTKARQAQVHLTRRWRNRSAAGRIERFAKTFAAAYGTPDLGNLVDPLDEAAYIILTFQTDIPRARSVWQALRSKYRTWDDVMAARERDIAEVLRPSGLHVARARLLKALLVAVVRLFGEPSLSRCRSMATEEAEKVLRALPGLDRKSARCVLLYSLGRPVFPVDSNAYRFALRYGILRPGTPYRRAGVHDELQRLVPRALRHDLHVNLVVHGQRTCTPRNPRCDACPVRRGCATASRGRQ